MTLRILLVEHNPADARLVHALLDGPQPRLPVQVLPADRLQPALETLRREPVDLALVNLRLPDSQGLATIDSILACAPDLPLIVLGDDDDEVAAQALERGAQDYLPKTRLTADALIRSIRYARSRVRATAALHESELRFRQAFQSSPVGMCLTDPEARIQTVNRAFCQLMNRREEELVGQFADLLLHPGDVANFRENLRRCLHAELPSIESTERRPRPDGSVLWCRSNGFLLRRANGEPLLFLYSVRDVTAEEMNRQQLAHERLLLTQVLDMVPDAIFFKDRKGRFVRVNPAAVQRLGCTRYDQIIGRTDDDFFSAGDVRKSRDEEDAILKTGLPSVRSDEQECWMDGRRTWVSRTKLPLCDERGRAVGIFGIVHDVTQSKLAEQALRNSEQQYRHLFDFLPHPMWVQALQTSSILAVNAAALAHYGYTREEFLSMSARDLVISGGSLPGGCQPVSGFPDPATVLCRHRRKDGAPIDVEVTVREISFNGQPAEYALVNDVTERLRGERALRESESRYRSVVEQVADAILLVDPDSLEILDANQSAQLLLGYSAQEFRRLTIIDLAAEGRDAKLASLQQIQQRRRVQLGNGQYVRRDGTLRLVERAGSIIQYGGREVICVVVRDIQRRVELESQLRQSQKLEAVGRLAGGVAHDFNNILTVITAYCDDLLDRTGCNPALEHGLSQISAAASRAASLTRQLLAFSRKQVLQPRVVDLNERIDSIGTMLQRLIGEDIELSIVAHAGAAMIEADPSQLEQVILNLVVNARDAMPDGGRLTMETSLVSFDTPTLQNQDVIAPGDYVLLNITDSGAGMDSSTLAHIFEPFFSTKGEQGTGLGLSTAYGIIRQSGGYIAASSQLSAGSSFSVYFPVACETRKAPEQEPGAAINPSGTETILLVEDQDEVRAVTQQLLQAYGYRVLVSASAEQAMELCGNWPGAIELLLTDIVMPKVNGPGLARQIVECRPGIRLLFMSGYSEEAITRQGSLGPGAAFIQKPFNGTQLGRKIRELLSAPSSPPAAPGACPQ